MVDVAGGVKTALSSTQGPKSGNLAQRILDYAASFRGVPYVWGGSSPNGFDCSGLVQYVYNHFGMNLPRIADAQARVGTAVDAQNARPGDLVYFQENSTPAYDHIGIYLGNGMMLVAPHTGTNVQIQQVGDAAGFDRVLPQTAFASMKSGKSFDYKLPGGQDIGQAPMNVAPQEVDGRPAQGSGGGGMSLNESKPLSTKDYLSQDIDGTYGYLSAFLKNPEVGPIIAEAAKNGWSEDRMLAALEKTKWWKTTTASSRAWQSLKATDPGTAKLQLNQQKQQILQEAKSMGITLDPKRLNQLANTSIASSWSSGELQKALGAEFKYQGAQQTYTGQASTTLSALQQIAKQYVIPLSNSTLQQWTKQILEGTQSTDTFTAYAQQQAESLYPTLGAALKSGQTTAQYADPYIQLASQILEKPADQFDLSDPQWNKALLQPQPDGQRTAMTLSDWATYLRSTPDYQKTDQSKSAVANFGLALGNMFGKVSTPYGGSFGDTAINYGSS